MAKEEAMKNLRMLLFWAMATIIALLALPEALAKQEKPRVCENGYRIVSRGQTHWYWPRHDRGECLSVENADAILRATRMGHADVRDYWEKRCRRHEPRRQKKQ